jgi:hypothetical protein
MRRLIAAVWAVCALGSGTLLADVWDFSNTIGRTDDTANGTDNELVHGSVQVHDVAAKGGVADADHYLVGLPPRTSWEAVLDGFTGDVNDALGQPGFDRLDGMLAVVQAKEIELSQRSNYLRYRNDSGSHQGYYLRVGSARCTTACGVEDQYTIRLRETTVTVPRFNNSATQITVMILMNTSPDTSCNAAGVCVNKVVNATAHFRTGSSPSTAHTQAFTLQPGEAEVFNTATVGALQGISGGIVVTHDGGYGQLSVKAVALEPATGFSFDTPGTIRP